MFFIEDPAYTKHGYYLVNGIKTFSKFEAWQLSGNDISKIEFIFNDDVYSTHDWSKEPEEDIYELYRRRAHQLRKDYDYIVLIYSGGIDSHTILETFLQNNLRVDEICTFSNNDVQAKTEKFNQEVYNAAIPFVETLDLKKLGTKFRLVNIGQMIIDQLSDLYHFENFEHYSLSTPFWRTAVSNHVLKSNILEHRKLVESGKSVCYLWGHEKPSMRIKDQHYCLVIPDTFSGGFGAKQYNNRTILKNNFDNFYDEAFYICREFPEISIKQAHMLADLMLSIPDDDPRIKREWEIPIFGPAIIKKLGDVRANTLWLSKSGVDKCIYPRAIMNRFGDDKLYRGSTLFSKKDNWFYDSNHENKNKFHQKMNNMIKNNQGLYSFRPKDVNNLSGDTFVFGTQIIISKPYFIKKIPEQPNVL
jgi:hypothetical protein